MRVDITDKYYSFPQEERSLLTKRLVRDVIKGGDTALLVVHSGDRFVQRQIKALKEAFGFNFEAIVFCRRADVDVNVLMSAIQFFDTDSLEFVK